MQIIQIINQKEFSLRLKNAVPDFFVDAKFDKSLLLEMSLMNSMVFPGIKGVIWDKKLQQECITEKSLKGN